jgi:hypothetical protein
LSGRAKFLLNPADFLCGESALSSVVAASDTSSQPGYEVETLDFLRPALQDSEDIEAIGTFFLPQTPGWVYVACIENDPGDEDQIALLQSLEALVECTPMLIRSDTNDIKEDLTAQGTALPEDCDSVFFVGEGAACVRRVYGDEFDQCLQLLAFPHIPVCDLSHYPVGEFVSISKPGQYFGDVGCVVAHDKERNMDSVLLLLPPRIFDPADALSERWYNILTLWPPVATPSIGFLQALQQSLDRKCLGTYEFLWFADQWFTKDGLVGREFHLHELRTTMADGMPLTVAADVAALFRHSLPSSLATKIPPVRNVFPPLVAGERIVAKSSIAVLTEYSMPLDHLRQRHVARDMYYPRFMSVVPSRLLRWHCCGAESLWVAENKVVKVEHYDFWTQRVRIVVPSAQSGHEVRTCLYT